MLFELTIGGHTNIKSLFPEVTTLNGFFHHTEQIFH